jgi:hypothetical protein
MPQSDNNASQGNDRRVGTTVLGVIAILLILFSAANYNLVKVHLWPWGAVQLPTFALIALGFLGGVLTTILLLWIKRNETLPVSWIYLAIFCLAVMGVAAARSGDLSFAKAMLVIVVGSAALMTAARAILLLGQGETIELHSHWGGLGGALGGWRLSPATSLVLLTLAFTGSAIGVILTKVDRDENRPSPTEVNESKKEQAKAPPAPSNPAPESPKTK